MRRQYGSRLMELVDRPVDAALLIDLYAATAEALAIWEPRVAVLQVGASFVDRQPVIDLLLQQKSNGEIFPIDGIVIQ